MRISELTPTITAHFKKQVVLKGLDPRDIIAAWRNPAEVYPSGSHPGQWRVTGNGICIVGKPEGDTFVFITVYLDRVLTAPRADQMDTPEGRRYAQRRAQGLGRG